MEKCSQQGNTPYAEADAQGQAGEALTVQFTVVASGNSTARLSTYEVYPIPASQAINIKSKSPSASQAHVMLLDQQGDVLLSQDIGKQAVDQLDLKAYKKGVYYIKIVNKDAVQIERIVIE